MSPVLIPHTRPSLGRREAAAARRVLASGMINDGDEGRALAATIARSTGCAGGVVTSTGTHAIMLALRALGIDGPHHRVALPDFSCRAVYDAVRLSGASAVFVDIDATATMAVDSIASVAGELSAIVLPHLFGQPANAAAIAALGVPVIEDCAHSPGAMIGERLVGSFGHFAIYSFEGSKYVTAGEGGAVIAATPAGVNALATAKMGGDIAAQCRLADMVSAVAAVQWQRLDRFIARRKALAGRYRRHLDLAPLDGGLPQLVPDRASIAYRFIAQVDASRRDRLIAAAESKNILIRHPISSGCLSRFLPGTQAGSLRVSAATDARIISLPIYPGLTRADQDRVIEVTNRLVRHL